MEIGNKILELRKKNNLSQESLAEKLGVARQTISKWELGETSPDLKQAKELAKIFNITLDELVENDTKRNKRKKINNTEKLAGIIINILKVIGILFIVFLIIDIISLILFTTIRKNNVTETEIQSVEMTCSINDKDFVISIGSDGYFNCSNCPKKIQIELKDNYIDFGEIDVTIENINNYFKNNNGTCK